VLRPDSPHGTASQYVPTGVTGTMSCR
jgi:hypothetical protein